MLLKFFFKVNYSKYLKVFLFGFTVMLNRVNPVK